MPLNRANASDRHHSHMRLNAHIASEFKKWWTNFEILKHQELNPCLLCMKQTTYQRAIMLQFSFLLSIPKLLHYNEKLALLENKIYFWEHIFNSDHFSHLHFISILIYSNQLNLFLKGWLKKCSLKIYPKKSPLKGQQWAASLNEMISNCEF